jgi:hypothetical protein
VEHDSEPGVLGGPYDDAFNEGSRGSGSRNRKRGGWAGSGGRWWIFVGRIVLWAFIIVVVVNGIRAPFERFTGSTPAPTPTASPDPGAQFPSGAASAYAMQFAAVYLNYDQKDPNSRAAQLSYFIPNNADPQLGWDGAGQLAVQSIQIAGVDARDANNAVVTLLVRANPRWLQLAVPVYAQGGKMAISGKPALLPPPPHADLPQPAARDNDTDLVTQLSTTLLQGFFTAYGSGNTSDLSRYVLPGGSVPDGGLGGTVTFVQLGDVFAPKGPADQRDLTVTVTWSLASGKLDQTYQVSVVKKDGQWFVKDVRGATP